MAKRAFLATQGIDVSWQDNRFVFAASDLEPLGRDMAITGQMIARLLQQFGVGLCVEDRVLVPARLTAGISEQTRAFFIQRIARVLGRELATRSPNVFVPGFFPLLQLKAFERGARLWKGGLMRMSKDGDTNTVATIEALELSGDASVEDTHITRLLVCVYSRCAQGIVPMKDILEECFTLVRYTLRELVPSLHDLQSRGDVFATGPGCVLARLREMRETITRRGTLSFIIALFWILYMRSSYIQSYSWLSTALFRTQSLAATY
jgi:hypothetical protein